MYATVQSKNILYVDELNRRTPMETRRKDLWCNPFILLVFDCTCAVFTFLSNEIINESMPQSKAYSAVAVE